MRRLIAAACAAMVAVLPACERNAVPTPFFDSAGYHVRGGEVFYVQAFPGRAAQVDGADAASFAPLDRTFAKDRATVYVDGRPLPDADPDSFVLLDRPDFAMDHARVYQRDSVVSEDPTHFELLDGNLSKDGGAVYWSDGRVLSNDPAHFSIISDSDYYLFTKDGRTIQVNGSPVVGADPASFRVLSNGYARDDAGIYYFTDRMADADAGSFEVLDGPFARDENHGFWMGRTILDAIGSSFHVLNSSFDCAADRMHAYYRGDIIVDADPRSFPPGRAVTGCSEASVFFAP